MTIEPIIVLYTAVGLFTYWVYIQEQRDLTSKNTGDILRSASWQEARPDVKDSIPDSIGKMTYLLRATSRTVLWRRSFLASIAVTVLIWFLVMRRKPTAVELALTIGVTWAVFYHYWEHYSYHDFQETERTLQNNLLQLDRKLASLGIYTNIQSN